MSTCLFFHNDLDGVYSALALLKSGVEFDVIKPIEYGRDYSSFKDEYDEFVIVDFGENPFGDKTVLWIDHHLHDEAEEYSVFGEAPSCLRLMANKGLTPEELTEDIIDFVDKVDSADYSDFKPGDLVLPTFDKGEFFKYLILNSLLRKNKNNEAALHLLLADTFDIDTLLIKLQSIENALGYEEWLEDRATFTEKYMLNAVDVTTMIDGIPIIMTRNFSRDDWRGYDKMIFYAMHKDLPYIIITFEINGFTFQAIRNPFYKKEAKAPYDLLKDSFPEASGHEGILSFKYKNLEEGLVAMDEVISILSNA